MKFASLFILGTAVALIAVLLFVRSRLKNRTERTATNPNPESPRSPGRREQLAAADLGKRAFLRQLAIGSVASFAGWMATQGANAQWAEKLVLSSQQLKAPNAPGKRLSPSHPSHQDGEWRHDDSKNHFDYHDHTDDNNGHWDEHADNHEDYYQDYGASENISFHQDVHWDGHFDYPFHTDLHFDVNDTTHTDTWYHDDGPQP